MFDKCSEEPKIFLARQPIFDNKLRVFGYELLFRDGFQEHSVIKDGDMATNKLIANMFTEIGFDSIVKKKIAFINVTHNLLLNLPPLPTQGLVLEILENIDVDAELVQQVQQLSNQGYQFALDDFVLKDEWVPLIEMAKYVKIDILSLTNEQIKSHVDYLSQYPVKLLAEKIETLEQYEFCKQIGFDYFQGYFLSKPSLISAKQKSASKLIVLELLSELNDPRVKPKKLEHLFSKDPKLSYKLLRIINCAAYAKIKQIDSVHQAVVYLGVDRLKEWANLIAISSIDDKPQELMVNTMIRAKMCQIIATELGFVDANTYFTVGLLSNIDALMDQPMDDLLAKLPVNENIKKALLSHKGSIGEVLFNVVAYERAQWNLLQDVDVGLYTRAYLSSIEWAEQTSNVLM